MRPLLALLIVLSCSSIVFAEPVGLQTWAATGSSATPLCTASGTSAASCDNTYEHLEETAGVFLVTTRLVADAHAAYGSLTAHVASMPIPEDSLHGLQHSDLVASAAFIDTLTIIGGVGQGFVQYDTSGVVRSITENWFDPLYGTTWWLTHNGDRSLAVTTAGTATTDQQPFTYTSPLLPFTFGVPFGFGIDGQARSEVFGIHGFGDLTVSLDGIRIFDGTGARVENAILRSAALAPYATPIPEPTSLLLLSAGLLVGHRVRRIRQRGKHN